MEILYGQMDIKVWSQEEVVGLEFLKGQKVWFGLGYSLKIEERENFQVVLDGFCGEVGEV